MDAVQRHGYFFDYRKVNYINDSTKVEIICQLHGSFYQRPNDHLHGQSCPICAKERKQKKLSKTTEQFIEEAQQVHGDKYDYSKVNYINSHSKVEIICPIHGSFEQKPYKHLNEQGCPKCCQSHLENRIEKLLKDNDINYVSQKSFPWLKYNGKNQYFDFYLTDYNVAIECQGIQHFKPDRGYFKDNSRIILRDRNKWLKSSENSLKLYYFGEIQLNKIRDINIYNESNYFSDEEELLRKIFI